MDTGGITVKMFHNILFPVDFSEASPKIAPWVIDITKRYDSKLHLLFVARSFKYFDGVYVPPVSIQTFEHEIIEGGEKQIEEFARTYCGDFPVCKTRVVLGDAAEEIIKYIKSEGIDLVIMGTHGRKGLDRIIFGSVADRVIKMSPVPVMSINPYRII
jgi:nucleotide-binding universal stress UspA family protein